MIIAPKEILGSPITTNKIRLTTDFQGFFGRYSIISYYGTDKEAKNLAYEQLADEPVVSVTGINARWNETDGRFTRFFVLTEKSNDNAVLRAIREHDKIRSRLDNLEDYNERQRDRIIASLAINSLGKGTNGKMMYNNGSILLNDDRNFLVETSMQELICLKIEVNEYMNLTAKTVSFSNPKSKAQLQQYGNCVFMISGDVDGQLWSGVSVRPVVLRKLKEKKLDLSKLYIQKSLLPNRHNIAPYWPYSPNDYTHGKLFAITQVIECVNKNFDNILKIEFCKFPVLYYDSYKSAEDTMTFINESLDGCAISFEDPFNTEFSKALIKQMKETFKKITGNILKFPLKPTANSFLIKLCEPKIEKERSSHYTKSMHRFAYCGTAMQHKVYDPNKPQTKCSKAEARRILLELVIKNCLIKEKMPEEMACLAKGWEFARYKINEGTVIGAILTINDTGGIIINDLGFSSGSPRKSLDEFSHDYLLFDNPNKINGSKDYMVLKKGNNVFMIIDTEEIPILDAAKIDEAYGKITSKNEEARMPLSMFKRKAEVSIYLRGYVGLNVWKTEGINGEQDGSFSYISGFNSENMKIMKGVEMDRMPRARRLLILHKDENEDENVMIQEIIEMLEFGLGRWNEMMTYPFPFKFLYEYLDYACETAYSIHWSEIKYNGILI